MRLGALLSSFATLASAGYTIKDSYDHSNFYDGFNFFSGSDPTHGYVKFLDAPTSSSSGVAGSTSYAGVTAVYLGVDHTTVNPTGGRAATRVTSNNVYTHGLFIADIAHMPGGICGVWPAFWTFGSPWPNNGEIDIIEGVNAQNTNIMTLHTTDGCTMTNSGSTAGSNLFEANCNANSGYNGCGQSSTVANAYGAGFNANGGGVYAMEWTSSHISIYFFPRNAIPNDITAGTPNPDGWGTPTSKFTGNSCDIDSHFKEHNIVFDTTFCGDWAGSVWASSTCASLADTCQNYVANNPAAFEKAYWLINSVKVYTNPSASKRNAVSFQA